MLDISLMVWEHLINELYWVVWVHLGGTGSFEWYEFIWTVRVHLIGIISWYKLPATQAPFPAPQDHLSNLKKQSSKYTLPKYWKLCLRKLHCQCYGKYAFECVKKHALPKVCFRILRNIHCHSNGEWALEYLTVYIASRIPHSIHCQTHAFEYFEACITKVMESMLSNASKHTLPTVCFRILRSIHCQSNGKNAFECSRVYIAKSILSNTSKCTLPQ